MKRKPANHSPLTEDQAKLVEANIGLAYSLARRFSRGRPHLLEGLNDAAIDGLIAAARDYDPTQGFAIGSLAGKCIRQRMINFLNSLDRKRTTPDRPVVSLDREFPGSLDPPAPEPQGAGEGPDFEELIAGLRSREKLILRARHLDGKTLREIGKTLGCTKEWVRKIELRALKKLATLLDPDGLRRTEMPAHFFRKSP